MDYSQPIMLSFKPAVFQLPQLSSKRHKIRSQSQHRHNSPLLPLRSLVQLPPHNTTTKPPKTTSFPSQRAPRSPTSSSQMRIGGQDLTTESTVSSLPTTSSLTSSSTALDGCSLIGLCLKSLLFLSLPPSPSTTSALYCFSSLVEYVWPVF